MSDEPDPATVVADADVLAADLLCGGSARDALDPVRAHSWTTLVVSDPLLDDAEAVVADLADAQLAAEWRERIEELGKFVKHPADDQPALACAYHGNAAHLVTFDDDLRSVEANASLKQYVTTSVKSPDAFARLFNPERLYPVVADGEYPGPDRDPRT